MVLYSRSLPVELVVGDPRNLALLGAVETARSGRPHRSGTLRGALGQAEETALGNHGGWKDNWRWEWEDCYDGRMVWLKTRAY